jgi:competence protein ComEC
VNLVLLGLVVLSSRKVFAQILIIALLIGALGLFVRQYALSHNYLTAHLGQVELIGSVKSELSPKNTFLLSTQSINGVRSHLPVRVLLRTKADVSVGQKLSLSGTAVSSREVRVAALIFAKEVKVVKNAKPLFAATEKIRANFRNQASKVGGDAGSLIPGLVLGDTKLESADFISKMRRVGLTHLTAVSGENFALVAAFIGWLLRRFILSLKTRLVITSIILGLFIFLVRPSPSVIRASAMTAIALLALFKGAQVKAISSLGAAVAILILVDPFQGIDPGFALSVGATAGIILISPRLPLPEPIAIPVSATIMCTPIIIALSGTLSLISIPANILAAPLVAPITVLGFIAALVPFLAPLLLFIISPFAKALVFIAHYGSSFPVLQLPKSFLGAALTLGFILLFVYKRKLAIFALIPIFIYLNISHFQFPGRNWEVANCDVGQGDGLVINLGNQQAMLIDAGPDEAVIDNCLNTLGIKKIALLVLTHFHADHVGGLAGAIKNRQVGQVWLTSYTAPFLEREQVLRTLKDVKKNYPTSGTVVTIHASGGPLKIKVIWPEFTFKSYENLPGDGSSINNSSIALLLDYKNIKTFVTGDIEPPVQEAIYLKKMIGRVDILKVPHHGSAYQYPQLLSALAPKISLISVGVGNKYGHPAIKTIELLVRAGSKVMRTDLDGAIAVDPSLSIRTKKSDWWDIKWG